MSRIVLGPQTIIIVIMSNIDCSTDMVEPD